MPPVYYPAMRKIIIPILLLLACNKVPAQHKHINPGGKTIQQRVVVPAGYSRMQSAPGSFSAYVQQLPLLPDGTPVHYYNGKEKPNRGIYVAVVDMNIGNKDLQQCADVIMHVRADYLYKSDMRDKIQFTFTNGFVAEYSKWMQGYRISVKGDQCTWVKSKAPSDTYSTFTQYMDMVYNYCGTLSLRRELKKIQYEDIRPGDVLIKGGSPGHAEMIMDVAQDRVGHKIYLLAQSYMPAQQMQLLENPTDKTLSPWYEVKGNDITTPEWNFTADQVMRFADQ
jgi:hypothetical protein